MSSMKVGAVATALALMSSLVLAQAGTTGGSGHAGGSVLTTRFAASPVAQRELSNFAQKCHCTKKIEAARAELHSSLDKVLIIDMRFAWNGVGNSLVRWLALLRFGTAAGRATFLWMSDRESHNIVAGPVRNETQILRPVRSAVNKRKALNRRSVGRRLGLKGEGGGGGRGVRGVGAKARGKGGKVVWAKGSGKSSGKGSGKATGERAEAGGIHKYPNSKFAPSPLASTIYKPFRSNGFDLGDYFVSIGADYRWCISPGPYATRLTPQAPSHSVSSYYFSSQPTSIPPDHPIPGQK